MKEIERKAETDSRASTSGAGDGTANPNNDYPVVRLIHETAGQLGCGVLVADNWVLTVSHCVAGRIPPFEVELAGSNPPRAVARSIHWSSKLEYHFQGDWPEGIEELTGPKDELVLIQLWGELKQQNSPAHITYVQPTKGDSVAVPTLGQTSAGDYPDYAMVVAGAKICDCNAAGRTAVLATNGGAFLPDDSGSPVFYNSKVVGLLSSLGPLSNCCANVPDYSPGTEAGQYLQITGSIVEWITNTVSRNHITPSHRAFTNVCFKVRRARTYPTICRIFTNQHDLDTSGDKKWYLDVVPKPNYLRQCAKATLTTLQDVTTHEFKTHLIIENPGPGKNLSAQLKIGKQDAKGIYYLSGPGTLTEPGKVDASTEKFTVYAYAFRNRIDEEGKVRYGIRIELFLEPSTFARPERTVPDCTVIGECSDCPPRPLPIIRKCQLKLASNFHADQDLQDDDGNGFEDPL